jgi:general secretion pathway protein A
MSEVDSPGQGLYLAFYGLVERPFSITPDPRYLFLSGRHAEALAHLVYGIDEAGGFIQLTGEVGTGKTTVIRALLARAPQGAEIALIFNPRMDAPEFMLTICEELGIMVPNDAVGSVKDLIDILNVYLMRAHAEGRRVVLIVDEAQNLSPDLLEQVRLLTNLETDTQKLLQIILIGQPELRDLLGRNDLRQLAQRITGRYHLEPLSRGDAERYVKHRLRIAGATHDLFTDGALRELFRVSGGVPRLINIIADRALLGGYSLDRHQVSRGMVRRAAGEVFGRRVLPRGLPLLLGAAAVGIVAVAGWLALDATATRSAPAAVTPAAAEPASQAANVPAPPKTLPELLRAAPAATNRDPAWQQLFSLWQLPFTTAGQDDACEQALKQGLECLGQHGTPALLRALDRPVMLDLVAGESRQPAILTALDDAEATLWFGGESHTVPVAAFQDAWQGDFMLLWRPPSLDTRALSPGMRGAAVKELRARLARWHGRKPSARDSDTYDAALQAGVRELQRQFGLPDDGVAGTQTQAVLDAALALPGTPRLAPPKSGAP